MPQNRQNYKQFNSFKDVTDLVEKVIPVLTTFEKHIGLQTSEDRLKIGTHIENHKIQNPNWNKPSVRQVDGCSIYKKSNCVELGESIPVDDGTGGWVGLPHNLDGISIHPQFPHQVLAFKDGIIYARSLDTTEPLGQENVSVVFPEVVLVGDESISGVYRYDPLGNNPAGEQLYHNYIIQTSTGTQYKYGYNPSNNPVWTHLSTGTASWIADYEAQNADAKYRFRFRNGVKEVEGVTGTSGWTAYGTGTSIFPTLPNDVEVDGILWDKVNGKRLAFLGDKVYDLNDTTQAVNSITPYNQTPTSTTLKKFKWTKPNHPFQLNLDYCSEGSWDDTNNPVAGSVQFWNGDRRSSATGLMTAGNWIDGELYTLHLDKNATQMTIYSYGDNGVGSVEQGVQWKIEGWGQTILRGRIDEDEGHTILVIKMGSNLKPEYRPFDSSLDVNPQEQFTQANTEVEVYLIKETYENIAEGKMLHPELIQIYN